MPSVAPAPARARPQDAWSAAEATTRVNAWGLTEMPFLNREILENRLPRTEFAARFSAVILDRLPPVEEFTPEQAQRLVVVLGLAGASVGRHYQEADPAHRSTPTTAFDGLSVPAAGRPFRAYFARVAAHTGTGHGPRDTFASLVRWNLPPTEVRWAGEKIAELTSVFDDGQVRSYTGVADEHRFFGLLKASEALELAVNLQLIPLSDGDVDLLSPEAMVRLGRATVLLDLLRRLNHAFAARPPEHGLRIEHFMDVFRQFAVRWEPGDIPPSGALDPEWLARDLLLGIRADDHMNTIRQVFPGLLGDERAMLENLGARPTLPVMALQQLGITDADLNGASPADLRATVDRHPVLAALYVLLTANARMAGVHLMLSKRFLFSPQRRRDSVGYGDPGVVSNRRGTTGMDERRLESLTRGRRQHPLIALHRLPGRDLEEIAGIGAVRQEITGRDDVLRFVGAVPDDLGLPDDLTAEPPHGHTVPSWDHADTADGRRAARSAPTGVAE